MGDPTVEVTEESRDTSQIAKGKASKAISEGVCDLRIMFILRQALSFLNQFFCVPGNFDLAIEHLTEAILLNPKSAIMYGTRGTANGVPIILSS